MWSTVSFTKLSFATWNSLPLVSVMVSMAVVSSRLYLNWRNLSLRSTSLFRCSIKCSQKIAQWPVRHLDRVLYPHLELLNLWLDCPCSMVVRAFCECRFVKPFYWPLLSSFHLVLRVKKFLTGRWQADMQGKTRFLIIYLDDSWLWWMLKKMSKTGGLIFSVRSQA